MLEHASEPQIIGNLPQKELKEDHSPRQVLGKDTTTVISRSAFNFFIHRHHTLSLNILLPVI
jgi:hypothetical protein